MQLQKIDFLIVMQYAFSIDNIFKTTSVRKTKFFAKVIGAKRSSK